MQKSIFNERNLKNVLSLIFLLIYLSITSIYPTLPPLIGICFILFVYALDKRRFDILSFCIIYMVFFEIEKGFLVFSTLICFILTYKIFIYTFKLYFDLKKTININYIYICTSYITFFIFNFILNQIMWIENINFNFNIILYIIAECIIISFF